MKQGDQKEYEVILKIRYKGQGYQHGRITKFIELKTYRTFFNEILRIIKNLEKEENILSVTLISVNRYRKI